jgi:hypothetical protein
MYLAATELSLLLPAGPSIGASTAPLTLGETGSIIAEIEAELDGAAAKAGYAVPVSSVATSAYAQMQLWTRLGAGAQVLGIIYPNLGRGGGGAMPLAQTYREAYEAALKMLRKGEIVLVGAGEDTSGAGRELPRSYSTSNPAATVGVEPQIDMDRVF